MTVNTNTVNCIWFLCTNISNVGVEVRTMIEFEKDNSRLTPRLHSNKEGKKKSPFRATVLQQFEAVLWRSWLTVIKNPRLVQTRIIQAVVTALVLGIVFIGQNYHTQEGAMNVNGAILLMLIQMSYNTAFAVVEVIIRASCPIAMAWAP